MVPIHELLNRIKWDADFGTADFSLGYYDRVDRRVVVIPLARASFADSDAQSFDLVDEEGRSANIPLHRVKQVFRNGELIWSRKTE